MILFASFFIGLLNGLFASGAGQILILCLIFIYKIGTKEAHRLSVSIMSVTSVISLIGYLSFAKLEISKVIIVAIISVISGFIGTIIVRKIPGEILGLISGVLLSVLSIYRIVIMK